MSARVVRGRLSLTEYRVLKQFDQFALVELTLHTGRTHQIRVHMAHIAHPVIGDTVYGRPRSTFHAPRVSILVARPLLHAYKLGFTHPRSQEFMEFTAPVPDDMVELCES